jgi:toxin HigB-1
MLEFRNTKNGKALEAFWQHRDGSGLNPAFWKLIRIRLQALDAAQHPGSLPRPWRPHRYPGTKPPRWSIDVNGPWRITFEWEGGHATQIDLEQPH